MEKTIELTLTDNGLQVQMDKDIEAGEAIYAGVRFISGVYDTVCRRDGEDVTPKNYIDDIVLGLRDTLEDKEAEDVEDEQEDTDDELASFNDVRTKMKNKNNATLSAFVTEHHIGINLRNNVDKDDLKAIKEAVKQAVDMRLAEIDNGKN